MTMGKYLDPRADLTFKKILGEHKHLVISLLNAMLPLKEDEQVERIVVPTVYLVVSQNFSSPKNFWCLGESLRGFRRLSPHAPS